MLLGNFRNPKTPEKLTKKKKNEEKSGYRNNTRQKAQKRKFLTTKSKSNRKRTTRKANKYQPNQAGMSTQVNNPVKVKGGEKPTTSAQPAPAMSAPTPTAKAQPVLNLAPNAQSAQAEIAPAEKDKAQRELTPEEKEEQELFRDYLNAINCTEKLWQCGFHSNCSFMRIKVKEHVMFCSNPTCTFDPAPCVQLRKNHKHYNDCKDEHCLFCVPIREVRTKEEERVAAKQARMNKGKKQPNAREAKSNADQQSPKDAFWKNEFKLQDQRELLFNLLHAIDCKENSEGCAYNPQCGKIKDEDKDHIVNCKLGSKCVYLGCVEALGLYRHYLSCESPLCDLCDLVRMKRKDEKRMRELNGEDKARKKVPGIRERYPVHAGYPRGERKVLLVGLSEDPEKPLLAPTTILGKLNVRRESSYGQMGKKKAKLEEVDGEKVEKKKRLAKLVVDLTSEEEEDEKKSDEEEEEEESDEDKSGEESEEEEELGDEDDEKEEGDEDGDTQPIGEQRDEKKAKKKELTPCDCDLHAGTFNLFKDLDDYERSVRFREMNTEIKDGKLCHIQGFRYGTISGKMIMGNGADAGKYKVELFAKDLDKYGPYYVCGVKRTGEVVYKYPCELATPEETSSTKN